MAGDEINGSPKPSIEKLLGTVRTFGMRRNEAAESILSAVTGKKGWSHEQGIDFYEFILRHYIDDVAMLEMILAVSGCLDGYRIVNTATKRREKYLDYLDKNNASSEYKGKDPETLRKTEDDLLATIAERMQEDISNKKMPYLIRMWKLQWLYSRSDFLSWLRHIGEYFGKSINNKPVYWLAFICVLLLYLVLLFIECLTNIYSARQNTALLRALAGMNAQEETPLIKTIDAERYILVTPGDKKDLGLEISPAEASIDGLHSKVDNENLVAVTDDWWAVGLDGLGDKDSDDTVIVIWGGEAEPAIVNVIVEKPGSRGK